MEAVVGTAEGGATEGGTVVASTLLLLLGLFLLVPGSSAAVGMGVLGAAIGVVKVDVR